MARKRRQRQRERERNITNVGQSGRSGGEIAGWFRDEISRRTASQRLGKGLAWASALGMAGVSIFKFASDSGDEISFDSLELQRKEGWNIGSTEKRLVYTSGSLTARDSLNRDDWFQYLNPDRLISIYQPSSATWQPFFVPTLLQSLGQNTLRNQVQPFNSNDMRETYERAAGLKELISQASNNAQTLIISDLPGPSSIALGAALADTNDIIPTFDNWPHPLGVVPAHETLGAMLYYASEIEEQKKKLKADAPAVLLLDNRRLAAYRDEESQFDNRYLAKIPPIDQLKQRGVENILYIVRDEQQREELDDLNDEFVEFEKNNIGVRMLRLSDFKPYEEEVQVATSSGTPATVRERHYYYGGSPLSHWWFYSHYWYRPYPTVIISRGGQTRTLPRPTSPPPTTMRQPTYRPVSRPTIFSSTRVGGASGVGRSRPSGFGRTSVRMSGGRITGTRSGRSGSYGRSGGWFGG